MTPANGISQVGADVKRLSARRPAAPRLYEFLALAKPRVVLLIVFTAMIGMFLATPGALALQPFVFGVIGIALVAVSARPSTACSSRRSTR